MYLKSVTVFFCALLNCHNHTDPDVTRPTTQSCIVAMIHRSTNQECYRCVDICLVLNVQTDKFEEEQESPTESLYTTVIQLEYVYMHLWVVLHNI